MNDTPRWVKAAESHGLLIGDTIVAWVNPRIRTQYYDDKEPEVTQIGYGWNLIGGDPHNADTFEMAQAAVINALRGHP